MNKLTKHVKEHSLEYGSLPFWSWNDRLKEPELRRQIRNMHDLKINGFFMHARGGLETEYLSDEWYDAVKVCIDEAKKLGMEAWAYDENGWPSGFAGGKLLTDPDNHSVYLVHEITEKFPDILDGIYAVYAICADENPIKTDSAVDNATKYLIIRCKTDGSYVDTLRDDITEKFIAETHAQYEKRLGSDFGTAMPGFFTDEPQYFRWATPYSKFMEKWYSEEYGYSVFDAIPALFIDFEGAKTYRYDYFKMIHTKFMENFAKKIYDWACEHGIKITGHGIEESSLSGQILCQGSVMPFYEYEHIPGIDYLGRPLQTPLSSKQLGSACEQLGKKKALSEMFACCGWDVTPTELKHIAELQYSNGVNIMCQHLYPYSERGQRKRDYPAHYSEHNPWQSYLGEFNGYFNNLGYMLAMGRENVETLVIHPIHSAWLTGKRIDGFKDICELENNFRALFVKLSDHQIPYHLGEESMIKRHGGYENGKIKVGNCLYSTVILPALDTLDSYTVELLRLFAANGGRIYTFMHHLPSYIDGRPVPSETYAFLNGCPDLTDGDVFDTLWNSVGFKLTDGNGNNIPEIASMVRDTEYGHLYYFANLSGKEFKDVHLSIKRTTALCSVDIASLEISALRGRKNADGCEILLDFDGSRAFILSDYEAPVFDEFLPLPERKTIRLKNDFAFDTLPENLLTLDRASVSYDGKDFTEERPIERIRDNLLAKRYRGKLCLRYSFDTEVHPKKLSAVIETPAVKGITVNGEAVEIGESRWFDQYFADIDITDKVRPGKNSIVLEYDYFQDDYVYHVLYGNVMESLRNCLVFNTEIEAVYLKGDFAVICSGFETETEQSLRCSAGFSLASQKKEIDIRNIVTDGYPFYGGKLRVSTVINYKPGDPTVLSLSGRYHVCDVEVNGRFAKTLMFENSVDLSDMLTEGENTLTLTLCSSYRNLMGPHHCKTAEPVFVGPPTFSFEGKWKDGECPEYDPRYSFVRFGIDVE